MENEKIKKLANEIAATILELKPELKDLYIGDKFEFYPKYYELSIQFIESMINQKISINKNDNPKTK